MSIDRGRLARRIEQFKIASDKSCLREWSAVLDHLHDAVVTTDRAGIVTGWNASATRLYGIQGDDAVGHRMRDLVAALPTNPWTDRSMSHRLRRDRTWSGELDHVTQDGRRLHVTATSTVVDRCHPDQASIVTVIRNESEWLEPIERSEAISKSMLDALPAPTALVDTNGCITAVNRAWRYATLVRSGSKEACGVGANYLDVCTRSAESGDDIAAEALAGLTSVLRGDTATFSFDYECSSDAIAWFSMKAYPLRGGGAVVSHYDITHDRATTAELARVTTFDKLTGLPNRDSLVQRLEQDLVVTDPGTSGRTGVVFADVSRFRIINDSLGHGAGDEVLRQLAERLAGAVDPDDYLARFGGGVFAVVGRRDRREDFADLAARISSTIARPLVARGRELELRTTIGVAITSSGCSAESALSVADAAVHQAKNRGVGRLSIIDVAESEGVATLDAELELRAAIAGGQLELEYQAIVDTQNRMPCGFEALIRWNHPTRGRISPASFIALAEESGLIVPLGAWVLDTAVATATSWSKKLSVSVNLSPHQTVDPGLVRMVEEVLERHQFDPRRLILEVTEGSLMSDDREVTKPLEHLRQLGVRISIDDFGTGYSSLSYLRRLPVDIIKIDKSFVDELPGTGEPIVAAIITLATALDLDVTAEGVEHEEQLVALHRLGCGYVQGFHLHRPALATDLEHF